MYSTGPGRCNPHLTGKLEVHGWGPPDDSWHVFRRSVIAATLDSMTWVDAHCHLQLADEDPLALLARAGDVDWVVVPGIDAATTKAAMALALEAPSRVFATAGLHPHAAARWADERDEIARLATRSVAIGEIGLDYYRDLSPREAQREAFRDQLLLAADLDLPAVVHCRDAFADVHEIVEDTETADRVVLHCWTGGPRWTKRFLESGARFSFAGPVAFETGDTVRRGAALVPPERATVETDTPYLSPPPFRKQPNEPARVALVGEALARVWGMDPVQVAAVTSSNAARIYRP
ncbi:putative deoxyribonuclease YcfH [bacterium BMS3Abin02]|nr:putative deoxyribonuclease YcfH [bacterium BMS3Abin02]HDL49463.1 TatD family deoxyribonuclease [Actinomycetota bacterium]